MRTSVRLWLASLLVVAMTLTGCATPAPATQVVERVITTTPAPAQSPATPQVVEKVIKETVIIEAERVITATPAPRAKYIFVFVGDGMGVAQRNAAELYLAATQAQARRPEDTKLVMNTLPAQGMNTTYDLTSVIPDSASTATAIVSGYKTASGVIGMDETGTRIYTNLSEMAKAKGMKVGIISTVSIDHATPAAFYAHVPSRNDYYGISVALANSDYDFFGGGDIKYPTGKDDDQPDVYEMAEANGFTIIRDRQEFLALGAGAGKVWAINPTIDASSAMPYALDRDSNNIALDEFVEKAIELLDNPNGFLLAVEAGKIDWACHANDAAASIHDTIELDKAVATAVAFYEAHPDETLIVVTGDHETGGMTIGFAGTKYDAFFEKIEHQAMSYEAFDQILAEYKETHTVDNASLEDLLPDITAAFGLTTAPDQDLTLSDLELEVLTEAFEESMLGVEERSADEYTYLLYGGYEPLTVKLTTILNQKAGIGWTSYSHTGVPVQTSAIGVGAELFSGYYDQTDINTKIRRIANL